MREFEFRRTLIISTSKLLEVHQNFIFKLTSNSAINFDAGYQSKLSKRSYKVDYNIFKKLKYARYDKIFSQIDQKNFTKF